MARRKGMMVGKGKKGYHNVIPTDKRVHSMSSRGIKQPQRINPNPILRNNLEKYKGYTINYGYEQADMDKPESKKVVWFIGSIQRPNGDFMKDEEYVSSYNEANADYQIEDNRKLEIYNKAKGYIIRDIEGVKLKQSHEL